MGSQPASPALVPQAAPESLFTPKLLTVLSEGYRLADLRADVLAGLTVAVVALPLSMAIAIASGTTPDRGLITAIVGGFLVSMLSGSRFQVGGPAGAFIVLVAASVERHGIDGTVLATALAGVMLMAGGALRLGSLVRLIPLPVILGFTAGIASIIFLSQVRDALGIAGKDPAAVVPKIRALVDTAGMTSLSALAICGVTIAIIVSVRRWRPTWPGMLIAISAAAVLAAVAGLSVDTVGSRFGALPSMLPAPHLPPFSLERIEAVLPDALMFALLGAIESLLCAVVADSMTRRKHRSNIELVAQGIANVGSALFGGICVTGTVARTATNIRAGARSPFAGMIHSATLLAFMWVAAPLCAWIPMPALAGVLLVVAWNMVEWHAIAHVFTASRAAFAILLVSLVVTVFWGLVEAIALGTVLKLALDFARKRRF